MSWVRKASGDPHRCTPPMREAVYKLPKAAVEGGATIEWRSRDPDGRIGDLWRCGCGALWRIGDLCDMCDRYGEWRPHPGMHGIGVVWRPAKLWQRIRHWRKHG